MAHIPIDPAENQAFTAESKGSVIKVTATDVDIADAVAAGFDRLVVERSVDSGLTWEEATSPNDRPRLNAKQQVYTWRDRSGSPDYLYRTYYLNTDSGDVTESSEEIEGRGLAIRNLLTVEQLKARYLFGTDLTDDAGVPLSDAVYEHYILAAIRWLEHELDISLLPTEFVELHDYDARDRIIQLDHYPVIEVSELRAQYPSGQSIVTYPAEWLRVRNEVGQVMIVPTAGTMSDFLINQAGYVLIGGGAAFLPDFYRITYTAGFEEGRVPRNLVEIIGMSAALGPFNIFGDLIAGAGIATVSLSLDGLSQNIGTTSSATNSGYGSRIIQYTKQIKDQLKQLHRVYKRVGGAVVA